jgi:uncharacterized protein (TIGR02391 family)
LGLTERELDLWLLALVKAVTADPMTRHMSREGVMHSLAGGNFFTDATKRPAVERAVFRAWKRLEDAEVIEEPDPMNGKHGYRIVSEAGAKVQTEFDFAAVRTRNWLTPDLLHPALHGPALRAFVQGDFDSAVFEAFKVVEIDVRRKAGYPDTAIGVNLMKQAFDPDTGLLRDKTMTKSQQKRRMEFFAGAFGEIRNPTGHTPPSITDPLEAIEKMMTASLLLRIIS